MSFETYPPQVEEVIRGLHELSEWRDGLPLSYKLNAVSGRKDITEEYLQMLSKPFGEVCLSVPHIIDLIGSLVYKNFDSLSCDDSIVEEILLFVNSGVYEKLCRSWGLYERSVEDVADVFKTWRDARANKQN